MYREIPHRCSLLCTAISLSLLPLAGASFAQQDTVEEVIVTGSYIRRTEGFIQASSVLQLTAEDLQNEGTMNIGEVIQNLTFVNGGASAITNTVQGTNSRVTRVDLRGLGAGSTLTLLDGKRLVNDNVNALIPSIAIQRLDIVADGAAALYGNEAVAGVINFIPYKSYEGTVVEFYAEGDAQGDYDEHSVQIMTGFSMGNDIDVVLAGQFRQMSRLEWAERAELAQAGLTFSSQSNPGVYGVPRRGTDGNYLGGFYRRRADPNCGQERESIVPGVAGSPFGFLDRLPNGSIPANAICRFEYGDNRDYREPTSINQFFANATWDLSEDLSISFQGFRTRLYEEAYGSTSNPGNARIGELPVVRGEIPGNSFVARDANGNALYGIDADGNGVPDRGTQDLNGDGLNDYLLAANPTVFNGVPLMEDVVVQRLRPIGKANTLSDGHTTDGDNYTNSHNINSRYSLQADFNVPLLPGWEGLAAISHNYGFFEWISNQNYDITEMIKGLNCDTVNDRDACYSPFAITDPANLTSVHVMNAIAAREKESFLNELQTWDLVLNGDISPGGFELPGGPIAAAFGYQHRIRSFRDTPALVELAGNAYIGNGVKEVISKGRREIDALFAELSLPILSNLDVELAIRNENFDSGQESTDPKYGITWAPLDWLTLRATTGDAFIAPSLQQLFLAEICGLSPITDKFGEFSGGVTSCFGGNPNLQNESSESDSLGFDLAFGDFNFRVTWNQTDFVNRIVNTSARQIMAIDFFNFQRTTGFAGDGSDNPGQKPSLQQLIDWNNNPAHDPRIIRNPDDLLEITQVNTGSSNAESVVVEAFDIQANYAFSLFNWGDFRLNLQATKIASFKYRQQPGGPLIQAAGKQNDEAGGTAPALPEWKANLRLSWALGNHAATATVHYIDEVIYDGPQFRFMDRFANTFRRNDVDTITRWVDLDIAYSYRDLQLFGGEGSITVGMRNATDRRAQKTPMFAGVVGELQDPLGRVVYARFNYDF